MLHNNHSFETNRKRPPSDERQPNEKKKKIKKCVAKTEP